MTISETDIRRFRILQVLEVEACEQVRADHVLDTLVGFHFAVARPQFEDDIDWLDDRGFIQTGPCPGGTRWLSLTDAGREVIELVQPGPALRSIALGRGAHLTLCSHEAISASKLDTLAAAARALVDTVLGDPKPALDEGARPDSHLGARETP